MEIRIPVNLSSQAVTHVDESLTAERIGSGLLRVLATPMMIALMEKAALDTVQPFLPEGWTTVGTKVHVEHTKATLEGDTIIADALLVEKDGRRLKFDVKAKDSAGLIGVGIHERIIVNTAEFLKKVRVGNLK